MENSNQSIQEVQEIQPPQQEVKKEFKLTLKKKLLLCVGAILFILGILNIVFPPVQPPVPTQTGKSSQTSLSPLPTTTSTEKPTSQTPTVTAKLSCKPRPACLDATPRCMIPETSDMCPKKVH